MMKIEIFCNESSSNSTVKNLWTINHKHTTSSKLFIPKAKSTHNPCHGISTCRNGKKAQEYKPNQNKN